MQAHIQCNTRRMHTFLQDSRGSSTALELVRNPHKYGWSSFMASLKAKITVLQRTKDSLGMGKLGTRSRCDKGTYRKAGKLDEIERLTHR